jgi:hypothetical protein
MHRQIATPRARPASRTQHREARRETALPSRFLGGSRFARAHSRLVARTCHLDAGLGVDVAISPPRLFRVLLLQSTRAVPWTPWLAVHTWRRVRHVAQRRPPARTFGNVTPNNRTAITLPAPSGTNVSESGALPPADGCVRNISYSTGSSRCPVSSPAWT